MNITRPDILLTLIQFSLYCSAIVHYQVLETNLGLLQSGVRRHIRFYSIGKLWSVEMLKSKPLEFTLT